MQRSRNLFILFLLGLSFGLSVAEEIQRPIKVVGDEPVLGKGTATITDLKDGRYEVTVDDLTLIGEPDIKPQKITGFQVGLIGPNRRDAREGAVLGEFIPDEVTIWAGDRYSPGLLRGIVDGEPGVSLSDYSVCVLMNRTQIDYDKRRTVWIHYDAIEGHAEAPPEVRLLREEEDKVIDFVLAPFLKHKQRYLDGLKTLESRYNSANDQEGLLTVQREIESIRKSGRPTDVRGYPDLEKGQDFFISGRDNIGAEMFPKLEKWVKQHHSKAEQIEAKLSQEGKTESAAAILEEKTRLEWMVDHPETIPAVMGVAFLTKGSFAEFDPDTVALPFLEPEWLEDRNIVPALVNGGGNTVTIGTSGDNGPSPAIKLLPETELSDAEMLTQRGTLTIEEAQLRDCRFLTGSHGRLIAESSLFIESTIEVKGSSLSEPKAAKLEFNNCRFAKSHFVNLPTVDAGLKITNCTFSKITFPSLDYREEGGQQIGTDEFFIENCAFYSCEVPISLALMTKNCIFNNCQFIDDSDLVTDPRQIEVRMFITDDRPTLPTSKTGRFTFTLETSKPTSVGDDLDIEDVDGRLRITEF